MGGDDLGIICGVEALLNGRWGFDIYAPTLRAACGPDSVTGTPDFQRDVLLDF